MHSIRVAIYLNQFFAGIGGEDKAGSLPNILMEATGLNRLLKEILSNEGEPCGIIYCGDNYFAEHEEEALQRIRELLKILNPQLLLVGPAFSSGRYGWACAKVGLLAKTMGIPVVAGMSPNNPGVEICRREVYIIPTGESAREMKDALGRMVRLGLKLVRNEPIGAFDEEGYIARGYRKNFFAPTNAAVRAVQSLLAKIKGETYQTEIPLPNYDQVPPAPPIKNLREAKIALITEAGIVPKGNPDRLESARATKWLTYSLEALSDLKSEEYQTVHGGFDNTLVNQDPDRVLPIDVMRELEREGVFGSLHPYYYVTTGMATTIENAIRFGREIAQDLRNREVQGALLTST